MRLKPFLAGLFVAGLLFVGYLFREDYVNTKERISGIEQFLARQIQAAQEGTKPNAPTPKSGSSKAGN